MSNRPWLKLRRREAKRVQKMLGGAKVEWIGGRLYFSRTKQPVPGAKRVRKPGRPACGLKALSRNF